MRRDDAHLLALIEEWGTSRVNGWCAGLKVVEVPDGVKWRIEEYDGWEHVAEEHRTWG